MKSAKDVGPTPTGTSPAMKPTFSAGIDQSPKAPPDQPDRGVGAQIGLLNTEKDIKGIQKVGI